MYSVRHPARRYDREYIAYSMSVFSLCVAGLICRCGSVGKHGGFCFFSFPAVSMISCPPSPRPPFPLRGRGSLKVYFAGGFAPGTPALNRLRHLQTLPYRTRRVACPAGRRLALPLALFLSPIPPSPLPLRGRGSPKVYFAGGFAPGTPALNRLRHLQTLPYRNPAGGLPGRSPGRRALAVPSGWFARQVAGSPCLELYLLPPSPCPPSRREGGF